MDEYRCTQNLMQHTLQHVKVVYDFMKHAAVHQNMNQIVKLPVRKRIKAALSSLWVIIGFCVTTL